MSHNSYLCETHSKEADLFCLCGSDPLFLCPTCLPKHEGHDLYPIAQSELFQAIGKDKAELKRRNILSQKCQNFLERVLEREAPVLSQAKALMMTVSQNYEIWLEGNHRCFESLLTTLREETALLLTRPKYRLSSITQKLFEKLEAFDMNAATRFTHVPEIDTLKKLNENCQEACSRASKVWQEDYEETVLQAFTVEHQINKRKRSPSSNNEEVQQLTLKLEETTHQLHQLQADLQAKTQYCSSLEKENETWKMQSVSKAREIKEFKLILEKDRQRISELEGRNVEMIHERLIVMGRVEKLQANINEEFRSFVLKEKVDVTELTHPRIKFKKSQHQLTQIMKKAKKAVRRKSVLKTRLRNWGIKTDPPIESQTPDPADTYGSSYALTRLGPYTGKDDALVLVMRGPVIYEDGIYSGQFNSQNEMHGYGKFLYNNGDMVEGQWRNGRKYGKGRYTWRDGAVYEGDFVDNKLEGFGIYYYSNGDSYSGAWRNGKMHGVGSWKFSIHSQYAGCRYIGEYQDGEKSGIGAKFWADGTMYVGAWKADNMHGKGLMGWSTGASYFGKFASGEKTGKGLYVWPDKDVYQGEWNDGKRSGQGRVTHPGAVEEGVWVNDVLQIEANRQ